MYNGTKKAKGGNILGSTYPRFDLSLGSNILEGNYPIGEKARRENVQRGSVLGWKCPRVEQSLR